MSSSEATKQPAARGSTPSVRVCSLVAAAVALAYVLLRHAAVHEYDAYWMLDRLRAGDLGYSRHPLSFHVADAIAAPLATLVPSLHERLRIVDGSCSGLAVGVLMHAVWMRERDRGVALATALSYAALPAACWFATVWELPGLFAPFAAFAVWSVAVGARRRPMTVRACIGVGAAAGLAAFVHGSGRALVVPLCVWVALELRGAGARWAAVQARIVALLATFACIGLGGPSVLHAVWPPETVPDTSIMTNRSLTLQGLPAVLFGEWLLPFAPVSVCWLCALVRGMSWLAFAFGAVLALYLAACQVALVSPEGQYVFHEFGAYQLPLGMLAAWIAARSLPPRGRLAMSVVSFVAGALCLVFARQRAADTEFGETVAHYMRGCSDRVVLAEGPEYAGAFEACFEDPALRDRRGDLLGARRFALEASLGGVSSDVLAVYLHPGVAGRHATISDAGLAELRSTSPATARLVDVTLPELFVLEPVDFTADGGRHLRGVRLVPRAR